jgi:hypothetical protein
LLIKFDYAKETRLILRHVSAGSAIGSLQGPNSRPCLSPLVPQPLGKRKTNSQVVGYKVFRSAAEHTGCFALAVHIGPGSVDIGPVAAVDTEQDYTEDTLEDSGMVVDMGQLAQAHP